LTLREENGRWLCRKSKKAKTEEDVTDIIVFDGDFASLMGKSGRTEFHAYLHKSGNQWLQMYGVTSLLGYWGEKDKLVQWAVDRAVEYVSQKVEGRVSTNDFGSTLVTDHDDFVSILGEARTAHKRSLNEASALGTDVHAEVEAYIKKCIANGGSMPGAIPEGSEQARLFMKWAEEEGVQFLASEKVVYSKLDWCAGTADIYALWKGKTWLLDIKTSNWVSPKHFFQLGGYARFEKEMTGMKFDACGVVHLPRGGGIKVVSNDDVGVGITQLMTAFELITSIVKMDKRISSALYS
jgi:hypothetical protein